MYFRWKDNRIVVKIAVWAANEGRASQYLYTLADAVRALIQSGEIDESPEQGTVGIQRNDEPVSVEESDRRFVLYFCHPPGGEGQFEGTPVDFKLMAPTAPVEGNRAFSTVLDDASGVLFLADGSSDDGVNAPALEALFDGLSEKEYGGEGPKLRVVLPPEGSARPEEEAFREGHGLEADVDVEVARPWNAEDAWETFVGLAASLKPKIRRAAEQGLIPTDTA